MSMRCDVVIPTYNNAAVLPLTLRALGEQEIPPGWSVQVLISDDGSEDDTVEVAKSQLSDNDLSSEVLSGPHTGPAGSRNRVLRQADADVIFFLGADIILRPGALAEHLRFHEENSGASWAALGFSL